MMRPKPRTLSVEVDARLAAVYRAAYLRAFGDEDVRVKPLTVFIAGFVEDRLSDEIDFVRSEALRRSK